MEKQYDENNLRAGIYKYRCIIKALLYMQEQGIETDPKQIEIIKQLDLADTGSHKLDEQDYDYMDWVSKLTKKEWAWQGLEEFRHWFKYTCREVKQYELAEEVGVSPTHLSQVLKGNLSLTESLKKHLINFRRKH